MRAVEASSRVTVCATGSNGTPTATTASLSATGAAMKRQRSAALLGSRR